MSTQSMCHVGLARLASLLSVRGVLRDAERGEWAHWLTGIARSLHAIDWKRDDGIEMQHRWPFEILQHLVVIPADAIATSDRADALELLQQAYEHYSADPLADTFVWRVAEVDAAL